MVEVSPADTDCGVTCLARQLVRARTRPEGLRIVGSVGVVSMSLGEVSLLESELGIGVIG